jgi:DNA mismatch repair protein MutS2
LDRSSIEMLEFPRVRERLAAYTSFEAGHELATSLQPINDAEHVGLLLKQSAEARKLLSMRPDFHIAEAFDIRDDATRAEKGVPLDPVVLLRVLKTVAAARIARNGLSKLSGELPALWGIARDIEVLSEVEGEISRCLSPTGDVLDQASAQLAEVRWKMRDTRRQLQDRLSTIVKSKRGQDMLQEQLITERNGRYVLPVRVESKRDLKGIVHDVSNTGATVFIEPLETVETGNELRQLEVEERQEIERILASLSAAVGAAAEGIRGNTGILARLDLNLAKAIYAEKTRAVEPEITSGKGSDRRVLRLVKARHPLLKGEAIPLSVDLGTDYVALIISGPNAGGKTVALKTIGLLVLMAQAGLPIPCADGTVVPVYDDVFADIGDEQSIEQTLSTFSAHIGNLARIVKSSTSHSLVLLDELGISTDPGEGAALAQAALSHFVEKGTDVVVTTHYSELKAFAHLTKGFRNASMDFDPVTLTPNYHLNVGVPGGSNALNIALRFGLPEEIVSKARGIMSKGSQEVEAMLVDLAAERKRLEQAKLHIEKDEAKVAELTESLEAELARIKAREHDMVREIHDNLNKEIAGLYRSIRDAENELKKERSRERVERAKREMDRISLESETRTKELGERLSQISEQEETPGLAAGDTVRLKQMDTVATVLLVNLPQGTLEAQVGDIKLTLRIDGVEKLDAPGANAVQERPEVRLRKGRPVNLELDLRGHRADVVESEVDDYLNDAYMARFEEVRIIHGYGTGAVRDAVRETLATHPLAKSFRPGVQGEGGDGATVVKMALG